MRGRYQLTIGLLALAIAGLFGCGSSLEREEAAVYRAYVDTNFMKVADSNESLKRHVICDHTAGFQLIESWPKQIAKLSVSPASDTVDNFLSRNDGYYPATSLNEETRRKAGRYPLNPYITFRLPHVLISDGMIARIFEQGGGWSEFDNKYRKHHGILWLSRVGFSKDRSQALLYVGNQYTEAAGEGFLVLLQKKDGAWKEITRSACWVS